MLKGLLMRFSIVFRDENQKQIELRIDDDDLKEYISVDVLPNKSFHFGLNALGGS